MGNKIIERYITIDVFTKPKPFSKRL